MSAVVSSDMSCGLPACNASEYCSDGHAEACQIALAQDRAGHDLASGPDIGERAAGAMNARVRRHFQAEICEGDAGAKLIAVEGGRIDGSCPVGLGRRNSPGSQPVEFGG